MFLHVPAEMEVDRKEKLWYIVLVCTGLYNSTVKI